MGNNLPSPAQTIAQLQQIKVSNIRLFSPNQDVLTALHDSGISVVVGTFNDDLQPLATDPSAAAKWVEANILPHSSHVNITCIAAGNEVYPGTTAQYLPNAMRNLDIALNAAKLSIPVSTAVSLQVLSAGVFKNDAIMAEITTLLSSKHAPLLVNIYPYLARAGDPNNVKLDFALFKEGGTVVSDGQYTYVNLFDSMTDAVHSALEKVGGSEVRVIVSETGWPTAQGADATTDNAQIYINNLIRKRDPEKAREGY
ncbi:hypothetical protein ACS0TY_010439 [Phlomoides rotata]